MSPNANLSAATFSGARSHIGVTAGRLTIPADRRIGAAPRSGGREPHSRSPEPPRAESAPCFITQRAVDLYCQDDQRSCARAYAMVIGRYDTGRNLLVR